MAHSTPGTRTTTDMLARLDSAVDELCACGCGRKLDPNGPSAWYASQDCQWSAMQRNATDPGEVYERPDPALDSLAAESEVERFRSSWDALALMPFTSLAAESRPTVRRLPIPEPRGEWDPADHARVLYDHEWRNVSSCPLPWRRHCRSCGDMVAVRESWRWSVNIAADTAIVGEVDLTPGRPGQSCSRCSHEFPLPLIAQWRAGEPQFGGGVVLRLVAPTGTAQLQLAPEHVQPDPDTWAWHLWANCERALFYELTYRHPCAVEGCGEKGKAQFEAAQAFLLNVCGFGQYPIRAGGFWLCPGHESDLFSMEDPYRPGYPLVGEVPLYDPVQSLRLDARLGNAVTDTQAILRNLSASC